MEKIVVFLWLYCALFKINKKISAGDVKFTSLFLANKSSQLINVIFETVQVDLARIRAFRSFRKGVKVELEPKLPKNLWKKNPSMNITQYGFVFMKSKLFWEHVKIKSAKTLLS